VTLSALAVAGTILLTSPAEAGKALSRKKVKRIVTKVVQGLTPGIVADLSYTKAQADDRFLGDDITVVRRESATDSANIKTVNVPCPAGMVVIGGGTRAEGASLIEPPAQVALKTDGPFPFPGMELTGWLGSAGEVTTVSDEWRLVVFAICVTP